MASLIEKLRTRSQKEQQQAVESFEQLVEAAAAGKDTVKPESAEQIIAAAGKTLADLEAAVTVLQQRRNLAAKLAEAERVQGDMPGLQKRLADAEATLKAKTDAATAEYDAVAWPISDRMRTIQQAAMSISDLQAKLLELAPASIRDEIDAVQAQISAIEKQVRDATRVDHRAKAEAIAEQAAADPDPDRRVRYRNEAKLLLADADEQDREVANLRKPLAGLRKRLAELHEACFKQ